MGEIRIVSPSKTHGYPYPVCKKELSIRSTMRAFLIFNDLSVCSFPFGLRAEYGI